MAFCQSCGGEVKDNAVVCVNCGCAIKKIVTGEPWSTGGLIALMIATVIIPFIGIGAGIYGLTKEEKRSQGGWLLGVSIVAMILWYSISN